MIKTVKQLKSEKNKAMEIPKISKMDLRAKINKNKAKICKTVGKK